MRGNPFNPGAGLDPPYFAGRTEETKSFSRALERVKDGKVENTLVHGLRGTGKTVLLRRFARQCADGGLCPVVNLQYDASHCSPETFMKTFQHDIEKAAEASSRTESAKKKIRTAGEYLMSGKVEVPGVAAYELARGYQSRVPLNAQIEGRVDDVWRRLQKSGAEGVVFLMDEFHAVKNVQSNNWAVLSALIAAFDTLQSNGRPLSLVLCGLPALVANVKEARSYSERMFRSMEISSLGDDDARSAVLEPLIDTRWSFSDDVVSAIVDDAGGYPYFIQFFASEVVERASEPRVGLDEYGKLREAIIRKLGRDFFSQRISALTDPQRKILVAMASSGGKDACFSDICKKMNTSKGAVSSHLKRLEEKSAVYKHQRGLYKFATPMLKDYVLDNLA